MPIDAETLAAIASEYATGMTSIRGRRVQRLLKREFAGAECVVVVRTGPGTAAVLGLSPSGAAICATDGRGKQASVVKWTHGSAAGLETQFDLHKDSLPALSVAERPLASLRGELRLHVPMSSVSPEMRPFLARALQVLA